MSDSNRTAYCKECKLSNDPPMDCITCDLGRPPDLLPANEDAWALWLAVRTQWRGGGMGVIGLDYAEVRWWASELEVDLSPAMWRKIRALEAHELERCYGADGGGKGRAAGASAADAGA